MLTACAFHDAESTAMVICCRAIVKDEPVGTREKVVVAHMIYAQIV
jgi:hypothetical protein